MIDLHLHSTFSDGSLTPEELVSMAQERGVFAIALTDHDTLGGVARFLAAGASSPVSVVAGVEISAEFSPGTMHLLGYHVDPGHDELQDQLERMRAGRTVRNRAILERLAKRGMPLSMEEVVAHAGEDVVGRPHIAAAMVEKGYVRDKHAAFARFLAKGRSAYVERPRFAPVFAVDLIRRAGGLAVLAHPHTLQLSRRALHAQIKRLQGAGLAGIECYYAEYGPEVEADLSKLAQEQGLLATGGSDFHGAANPAIRMGIGFGRLHVPDHLYLHMQQRHREEMQARTQGAEYACA